MNNRIIVSFTTTPSRINSLEPVILNVLREQTVKPNFLVLYLPEVCLKDNTIYYIPDYLYKLQKQYPNFIIKRVEDIGPLTKIFYALKEYTKPKDLIISIDDDILLEHHAIEEILDAHKLKPYSILGFMGSNNNSFVHAEYVQAGHTERQFCQVNGLGGYRSILYPRLLIDEKFFSYFTQLNLLHFKKLNIPLLEDDNYISKYFNYTNISMFVIGTFYPKNLSSTNILDVINITFLESSKVGALYGDDHTNISNSYKILLEYFNNLK